MSHTPLFNQKTIDSNVAVVDRIPYEHKPTIDHYVDLIKTRRIFEFKETEFHAELKKTIVEKVLGYTGAADAEEYTVSSEQAILSGSVDLALGHFSSENKQIIAPFELKDANKKDLDAIIAGRAKSPVQQVWEYATNAPGVKWVLVSNYLEIRLYGFGEGTQSYELFDLSKLDDPKEYSKFIRLLSADNLLSGATQDLMEESRKEEKRITDALYADYKTIRQNLIFAIRQELGDDDPLKPISVAQTILDRVLFIAFAEDTGLLPKRILEIAYEHTDQFNPKPIWENFKGLFQAIDRGNTPLDVPPYNGGLFAPDPIIDHLNLSDELCEGFKDIGAYDFGTEVSVTVLGRIFEQSISDVERLQAIARGEDTEQEKKTGTSGRKKRDGVVYTPDYIARFIVDQTLGTHLKEIFAKTMAEFTQKGVNISDDQNIKWKRKGAELKAWQAYRERIQKLRIVDPACGSGVFLVMAFDFMKAEFKRVNNHIASLTGVGGDAFGLFDPDSEILTNNLFGVDVNAESVEIAKLSLWVKTAKRGKKLDSLDANLKVGDSLIEDSNYAYLEHGFTWQTAFKEVFDEGGFDVVLGNPPYVRMEFLKQIKPYLETRYEVVSDRADLYAYFFERGLKLLKPGGRLGYISSSTFFKTGSGQPLRNFLRKNASIERIIDFGDIQIFDGVTTYPAILTMRNEKPTEKSELRFWNIKDLPKSNFIASFKDHAAPYPQKALSEGSWELENPALRALRKKITKGKKNAQRGLWIALQRNCYRIK
ncbi:MAG: N-6 DNA methylase [Rhizobiaceae bacterium]|nr:N-6 DNA methylase [Rhizobiaceae bacterium]